ncbi:MAG: glutamate--tRNA ligase family protein [Chloroflexota bacterium]
MTPARTMAPDPRAPRLPKAAPLTPQRTRFAPAPTGYLHLGHVANAIWVWRLAHEAGARVLLRIEDHDRKRCRPGYEAALLEDLEWLGFVADEGPVRQSDDDGPYDDAVDRLRGDGLVYGCDCSRTTFETWAHDHDRRWHGPGCPGGCRARSLDGPVLRVALGGGSEAWMDLLVGPCSDEVAADGDLPIRDRDGNWTYAFSVVVDDLRQDVDLIVRGRDLLGATAVQIRLARSLGRVAPPTFAHHPLVRGADGRKLSKADGATGVRDLRAAGMSPQEVIDLAAAAAGPRDPEPRESARPSVSDQR